MESDAGVALTLLNWTGRPLEKVQISLPDGVRFRAARAARAGDLKIHHTDAGPTITMPLSTVDVLLMER
jgi:hypothetical protein